MSCPGAGHCAGCGAGISVPPMAFACTLGLAWVAEHLVEVALISAGSGILSLAAVVALVRWQDRHAVLVWARRGPAFEPLPHVRATVLNAGPARPAIAPAPQVTVNIFGTASPEQAAAVRQLLSGQAGAQIITERNEP